MFKTLSIIAWAMKRNAGRNWIFTLVAVLWILSPFDDILLPVIDEVLLVLVWAWQTFQEYKKGKANKELPVSLR